MFPLEAGFWLYSGLIQNETWDMRTFTRWIFGERFFWAFSQHRLILFGLGAQFDRKKASNEPRGESAADTDDGPAHRLGPEAEAAPVPLTHRCILFRIFLYLSSQFRPPFHPPTPAFLRTLVDRPNEAFQDLTACWDVDTLCCRSLKQIFLASFIQPVSHRKYHLQIRYYAKIVLSPNRNKLSFIQDTSFKTFFL